MNVGERIKQRRKRLGISAEVLAEKLHVSPATIYRYESNDIMNMRIDKLEPIAKALQTTPAYLMGWVKEEDIVIHKELLISQDALLNIQLLPRLLDSKTGFTAMDAFNAVVENANFKEIMKDILLHCVKTQDEWSSIADEYNRKFVGDSTQSTKRVVASDVEQASYFTIMRDWGTILHEVFQKGLTPIYDIQKSDKGLKVQLTAEHNYLRGLLSKSDDLRMKHLNK